MDGDSSLTANDSSNAALLRQVKSSSDVCEKSSGAFEYAAMSKRRELTPEEQADAARLMAIYVDRKAQAKAVGRKLTQESVSAECGWSGQSAFSQYARGKVPLNLKALLTLAKVLRFNPAEVSPSLAKTMLAATGSQNVTETIQPYRDEREYPLISWVAAGCWQESCDNFQPGDADEWIKSDEKAGAHGYWLEVNGKSMYDQSGQAPMSFPSGHRILVQPEGFDLISGKYYIARLRSAGGGWETTFKQYVRDGGMEYLQPINPSFETIRIDENVEIIGRVIDTRPPKSAL